MKRSDGHWPATAGEALLQMEAGARAAHPRKKKVSSDGSAAPAALEHTPGRQRHPPQINSTLSSSRTGSSPSALLIPQNRTGAWRELSRETVMTQTSSTLCFSCLPHSQWPCTDGCGSYLAILCGCLTHIIHRDRQGSAIVP